MLKDHVGLWLDAGATLRGTTDLAQYRSAVAGDHWFDALVLARGVAHVAIRGPGTIDGNQVRNPDGEEHIRGPHAVLFYESTDISVRDVTITEAGNYALLVRSSAELTVDGLVVHGGWDGIHMRDVRSATISNCLWFAKRPSARRRHQFAVTRIDRHRAFLDAQPIGFRTRTSEQTPLTPGAASIAASVTLSAYAA